MEPLQWQQRGAHWDAVDYPLRYRITVRAGGTYHASMNGASIGSDHKFRSLEAAIDYVEHGGDPPRRQRSKER